MLGIVHPHVYNTIADLFLQQSHVCFFRDMPKSFSQIKNGRIKTLLAMHTPVLICNKKKIKESVCGGSQLIRLNGAIASLDKGQSCSARLLH